MLFAEYFDHMGTFYCYIELDLLTLCCPQVEPEVQKLYEYIYERGTIISIEDYSSELLSVGDVSKRVTESIRCGTDEWESLVSSPLSPWPFLTTCPNI